MAFQFPFNISFIELSQYHESFFTVVSGSMDVAPQVICRYRLIHPRKIPEDLQLGYEFLTNQVYPLLDLRIAVEFLEDGWLIFFERLSDFRLYYSRPLFSPPRTKVKNGGNHPEPKIDSLPQERTVIWEQWFEKIPPGKTEQNLAKIVHRHYQKGGSLGQGRVRQVRAEKGKHIFEIRRDSPPIFGENWTRMIRNGQFLFSREKGSTGGEMSLGCYVFP